MAKAPRSKKTATKSPAEDDDFILHSLQEALEKNKHFAASKEQMLHFYEQMLLIRRFEERAGQLYGLGLIGGAQVALGGGLAFANRYRRNNRVCLTYFGDGAANQGQVYETFNMASLWKLPIIFVVENNQYAMGTAVGRSSAETEFYRRGAAFRIPGMEVNGMDVLEVRQAAEIAFQHVREGKGPVLMECNTYRYRGHSMSDPAKYRTREEVQDVREHKDPIEGIKKLLLENGSTEDELKAIDKDIRKTVTQAADFAESSPEPEAGELYTDVLVGEY